MNSHSSKPSYTQFSGIDGSLDYATGQRHEAKGDLTTALYYYRRAADQGHHGASNKIDSYPGDLASDSPRHRIAKKIPPQKSPQQKSPPITEIDGSTDYTTGQRHEAKG